MAYNYNPYYPNYNNGATPDMLSQYKGQYQQPPMQNYQQPIQQMPQPPKPTNDMIWVQGEAGAKAYLVAPNNTVTLWDSESQTIYIKSADMNGVPSMQVLDFTYRNNAPQMPTEHACKCGDKFILKEDLKAVEDKIQEVMLRLSDVEDKYNDLSTKSTPKTTTKKTKGDVE